MNSKDLHFKNEIKKIMNYFNVAKYDVAIQKSKILLKKNPEFIPLFNIIGISYQKQKKNDEAKKIFKKGLLVDPLSLDLRLNLANSYKAERDFNTAEENYLKILEINSSHILTLLNYGNLKTDLNMENEAIELYDKALKIDDNNFTAHFNKSFTLQAIGNFKEAIFHAKKTLELNKNFTPADALLTKILDYKEDDWHLQSMLDKVKNHKLNITNLYNLHFAIGNAYEKIGKSSLSIKHINQANELKRKSLKFSIEDEINLFNKIKKAFEDLDINSFKIDNNKNNKNIIFVLGMPRSGTTLVEQIISSHSKVFGAGELFILSNIVKDYFFDDSFNRNKLNPETIKKIDFTDWQQQYNKHLINFKFNDQYVTDKNPLNFLWIGFIKIIFPNAKIIHCHRDPEETCLSIYKNNFPGTDLGWTYSQNELGNYYNLYKDLMKFWHNLFPNYIYDIKYEELINDQENESKSLVEACGLKWENDCLNFHENKKPIKTLSITQARQKIYKTSLNLSENYKVELKELFSILSK
jgi:tetratricopeptide (TPR) repeat protein